MIVIKEDFKDFNTGEFPYDKMHTALGEYHHFKNPGYSGNFYDTVSLHQWRSLDGSWMVTEEDGTHFMEQNRGDNTKGAFLDTYPLLTHKCKLYSFYTIEYDYRPFEVLGYGGVAFNYLTAREYSFFGMKHNKIAIFNRIQNEFEEIASKEYIIDSINTYHIKIEIKEKSIKVYINDILELEGYFNLKFGRRIALISKSQARFSNLLVSMTDSDYKSHIEALKKEEERLALKQDKYSKLELIKKIDLKNFGTGRQIRIVRYNNMTYILFIQHQKRYIRDSFAHISSMTLIDINGNIIWQYGEPNNSFENTCISADLPVQIADVNNDGKLELIYSVNQEVRISDFLTNKLIKSIPTPVIYNDPNVKSEPFYRLNVDAIRVLDFEGLGYKGDFIIKDRYQNVWGYNKTLENVWRYHNKNTGHFPYVLDINNDNKDELLIGYDLVSSEGKILWSLPFDSDHTDEIIYAKLHKNLDYKFILASGNEGMNIINKDGTIFKHNEVGHAQRVSVAKYDLNMEGLQIMSTSFWGSDSIIEIFDYKGNRLKSIENGENGNIITPVMYDGINTLAISNAGENGGLLDSNLDIVVKFPNDGHPSLSTEAYDIDDDGIDEILCWDQKSMWIYKASKFTKPKKKYIKYPDSGFSNYRGEYLISTDDLS
ncbi:MAG: hypothetical protein IJR67_00850 [Acholeplasmatales bacterium]|nr:hypothetical protein [Acholeplasmatales bacterium]